jgi:hypothetical protein
MTVKARVVTPAGDYWPTGDKYGIPLRGHNKCDLPDININSVWSPGSQFFPKEFAAVFQSFNMKVTAAEVCTSVRYTVSKHVFPELACHWSCAFVAHTG